jgi:putative membrane protein
MKTTLFSLIVSLGLLPVSGLLAAAPAAKTSCCNAPADPKMSVGAFACTVATIDMLEIQLGKVAQSNSCNPAVKKFGSYMIKSHTAINKDLTAVAAKQGIPLPTKLDPKHQAIVTKLSALKGPCFDKTYIPAMVAGHTKALAMFQAVSAGCTDPAMKKFAQRTTPIIAKHLCCAKKVWAGLQNPAGH